MNPQHLPTNGDNNRDLTDEAGAARQPAEKLLTPREVAAWLDDSPENRADAAVQLDAGEGSGGSAAEIKRAVEHERHRIRAVQETK